METRFRVLDPYSYIHNFVSSEFNRTHEEWETSKEDYLNKFVEEFDKTDFVDHIRVSGQINEMKDIPYLHNDISLLFKYIMDSHDKLDGQLEIICEREDGLMLCFINSLTVEPEDPEEAITFDIDDSDYMKRLCVVDDSLLIEHEMFARYTTDGKINITLWKNLFGIIAYPHWDEQ